MSKKGAKQRERENERPAKEENGRAAKGFEGKKQMEGTWRKLGKKLGKKVRNNEKKKPGDKITAAANNLKSLKGLK